MNRSKSALQSSGRWACGLALALCCSVGGAQHMHSAAALAALTVSVSLHAATPGKEVAGILAPKLRGDGGHGLVE